MKKIQIVKKGTPQKNAGESCPWVVDVPPESKK
jgi:hypothetical protein